MKLGNAQTGDEKIKIQPLWNLLENKYFLDDLDIKGIVNPLKTFIAKSVDRFNTNVLDRFINTVG